MDHPKVRITPSNMSCGILELSDLKNDHEATLFNVASYLYHPTRGQPAACMMWSDINSYYANGYQFYQHLNKLHFKNFTLLHSLFQPVENPKTSNIITAWIGIFDHIEFKRWYIDQRILKLKNI